MLMSASRAVGEAVAEVMASRDVGLALWTRQDNDLGQRA